MQRRVDRELNGPAVRLVHARAAAREGAAHSHAEAMLFLPVSGALAFDVDGAALQADGRRALAVRAGVRHAHRSVTDAVEYLVVYVDDARLGRRLRRAAVSAPPPAWSFANSPLARELAAELLAELGARGGTPDDEACEAATSLLCALAARGLRREAGAGRDPDAPAPDDPRLARAVALARARYREGVAPADLARAAGMSQRAFERALARATGGTPRQLVEGLRLAEARSRLESGRESITSVAFDLGYRSLSHFVRRFRAMYGAPPTSVVRRGGA